ncbi:MAG: hypothetical protein NTW51_10600 [Cyanobacteria bacterium]|nr:hypothetical protein [Cyanobacteriota bacterium]
MPYEPGSPECRVLIDCKGQIETMLLSLEKIDNSRHIRDQLVAVYNQLEGLHELQRRQGQDSVVGASAL